MEFDETSYICFTMDKLEYHMIGQVSMLDTPDNASLQQSVFMIFKGTVFQDLYWNQWIHSLALLPRPFIMPSFSWTNLKDGIQTSWINFGQYKVGALPTFSRFLGVFFGGGGGWSNVQIDTIFYKHVSIRKCLNIEGEINFVCTMSSWPYA